MRQADDERLRDVIQVLYLEQSDRQEFFTLCVHVGVAASQQMLRYKVQMMRRLYLIMFKVFCAAIYFVMPSLCSAETPQLSVMMWDGDPHDRIFIRNTDDCALVRGVLVLDFTTSRGRVLIDTQYGGLGTKDPMPVAVEHGPLTVLPVADGDRRIFIEIHGLLPAQSGTVTLDVDNEATGWFAGRVSILGEHLEGATARFRAQSAGLGDDAFGTFTSAGAVAIALPNNACTPEDVPLTIVPIS